MSPQNSKYHGIIPSGPTMLETQKKTTLMVCKAPTTMIAPNGSTMLETQQKKPPY